MATGNFEKCKMNKKMITFSSSVTLAKAQLLSLPFEDKWKSEQQSRPLC